MTDLVIGYDGSPDAQRAIEFAARTVRARSALVVCAWQMPASSIDVAVPPAGVPTAPSAEEQRELEQRARRIGEDGAARARAAGLDAETDARRCVGTTDIATTLVDVAVERDADLVVVGRRGVSRLEEMVLGSVSNAVLHDGRRPVLVVPGPGD